MKASMRCILAQCAIVLQGFFFVMVYYCFMKEVAEVAAQVFTIKSATVAINQSVSHWQSTQADFTDQITELLLLVEDLEMMCINQGFPMTAFLKWSDKSSSIRQPLQQFCSDRGSWMEPPFHSRLLIV